MAQVRTVLIEEHHEDSVHWLVSFAGPNPQADHAVRCFDKGEALKLIGLIDPVRSTDPSPDR